MIPMRSNALRRHVALLLACMVTACTSPMPATWCWAAYYGSTIPPQGFEGLSLVVLDLRYHPPLTTLPSYTQRYAYVSIGEWHPDRPETAELLAQGVLRGNNPRWGSKVADITSPRWQETVMADIAQAQAEGFDGVMLDTVDTALTADAPETEAARQARAATIALILRIRREYPNLKCLLNRGFSILPEVATQLDGVIAESIFTQSHENSGQFVRLPPKEYQQVLATLQAARARHPKLRLLALDYWHPDDPAGRAELMAIQRQYGLSPYVTTPDLTTPLW